MSTDFPADPGDDDLRNQPAAEHRMEPVEFAQGEDIIYSGNADDSLRCIGFEESGDDWLLDESGDDTWWDKTTSGWLVWLSRECVRMWKLCPL